MKTSLELSKKLKEAGFEKELEDAWYEVIEVHSSGNTIELLEYLQTDSGWHEYNFIAPAYDILNDLCVTYAKEIFGEKVYFTQIVEPWIQNAGMVLYKIQLGQSQKEIESYIWENSILNEDK